MTVHDARPPKTPTRRFTVAADGSTTGDDGDSGRLAASLRYACRVAGQLEYLTGAGDLEWVRTVSSTAVTARVGWSPAREVTLAAEVESGPSRTPQKLAVVGGTDVQAALAHCLQRVRQMLGTHWSAVVTADKRVVAAAVPQPGSGTVDPTAALPEVGVRALAVLGALEMRYRETCVLLDYAHGTMLVAAVGDHALYAFADKLDAGVVAEIVDEVRATLSPADVAAADTVATGETRGQGRVQEPLTTPSAATATATATAAATATATTTATTTAPTTATATASASVRPAGARVRARESRRSRWGRRRG